VWPARRTDHGSLVLSIENQVTAIGRYAARRNDDVVRTFADPGRSGLTMKRRPGLQHLLAMVDSSAADFAVILVYDVSRWGRLANGVLALTITAARSAWKAPGQNGFQSPRRSGLLHAPSSGGAGQSCRIGGLTGRTVERSACGGSRP
jgi:hypothetical protein